MAEPAVTLLLNFRRADLTVRCLEGLLRAAPAGHRVLVLDNGSGSADAATLSAAVAAHRGVELRLLDTNVGYCAAINQGLAWAEGVGARHVLLLNNDVTVEPGFLETMVEVLDNDPGLAGVGPTILRPDGRVWCEGGETGFAPNLSRLIRQGGAPAPRTAGPKTVGYLPGACALYRLDDLRGAGGLDERYFMYFEDIALGSALREHGRRLLWLPWVQVVHAAGSSSGGGRSPLRKYLMAVNSTRYLRQHFSLRLGVAFFLFDCLGLPLAYLTGGPRVGWAKTAGLVDGLRGRGVDAATVDRWVTT